MAEVGGRGKFSSEKACKAQEEIITTDYSDGHGWRAGDLAIKIT
jgi:hypothetical protein